MGDIYCYSYVEDAPSAEVVRRLIADRNMGASHKVVFLQGFPFVTRGCSALKSKCPSFLEMARGGLYTVTIADLDNGTCAAALVREWFGLPEGEPIALPRPVWFRVAIREVEAWIISDREAWADYIQIPARNFASTPDDLPDPKLHLLNIIRRKGHKRYHKDMLPRGTASIGPGYNEVLCKFVQEEWSPARGAACSPSLMRAIKALKRV